MLGNFYSLNQLKSLSHTVHNRQVYSNSSEVDEKWVNNV